MPRIGLSGAALVLCALSAAPAWAGVREGVEAWSQGDYARAVAQWQGPAAQGDADAQFNLAQAYKLGMGVKADIQRAENLYYKAAQQGHLQAADTYGLLLFQSNRREAAMPWLIASAERGEPRAQYVLAITHFNGDLAPRDPVRAYALMSRAAATGIEAAQSALTSMDQSLPIEQRQQGVALAAELEAKANQARAAQLTANGLGDKAKPVPRPLSVPRPVLASASATSPAFRPEPVSAGADFANPVVLGATRAAGSEPVRMVNKPKASPPAQASPALARSAPAGAWRVQLGAFGVAGNAQALWGRLKGNAAFAGRQAFFVPAGKITKLQAGPFASRAEAETACSRLSGQVCIAVGG